MEKRFEVQREFTKKVLEAKSGAKFPLSEEEKVKWTKEYVLNIISECNDLLVQLDWKSHWSNHNPIITSNVGIEIVDLQKYVWGLTQIWDISKDQFLSYYDMKTAAVNSKFEQESLLRFLVAQEKVCIIDIDGVLTPYPDGFLGWVRATYNLELDPKMVTTWEHYKDLYRQSGAKRDLPVIESSKQALIKLKERGYTIVLLTNRPVGVYQRIYSDTIYWLTTNGIPYDYIFWAQGKKILEIMDKVSSIKFIVDDDIATVMQFDSAEIKSYFYGNDPRATNRIDSLMEIEEVKDGQDRNS